MARFINPLSKFDPGTATDDEYLAIRLLNFKNLADVSPLFYDAVEEIVEIQNTLQIAANANLLQSSPFAAIWQNYKKVIGWLKNGARTSVSIVSRTYNSSITLPAHEDYSEISEDHARKLIEATGNWRQELDSSTQGQFIKLAQAVIANREFRNVKSQFEQPINDLQKLYEDSQTALKSEANSALESISDKTKESATNAKSAIEKEAKVVLGQIKEAQVLEIWDKNYSIQIDRCRERLYGDESLKWWQWPVPFARRRALFLMLLGASSAVVFVFIIWTIRDPNFGLEALAIAKILASIGLLLIPSIMYSSANKSYRVYLNQLDEYEQRAVVAQTLQGMMSYIDQKDENKDIRENIASIAASAMFNIRNTGHLTKRGDETGFFDLTSSMLSKK